MRYFKYDFSTFTKINSFLEHHEKKWWVATAAVGLWNPGLGLIVLFGGVATKKAIEFFDGMRENKRVLKEKLTMLKETTSAKVTQGCREIIEASISDNNQIKEDKIKLSLTLLSGERMKLSHERKFHSESTTVLETMKQEVHQALDRDVTPLVQHYNAQLQRKFRSKDDLLNEFSTELASRIGQHYIDDAITQKFLRSPDDTCTTRYQKRLLTM